MLTRRRLSCTGSECCSIVTLCYTYNNLTDITLRKLHILGRYPTSCSTLCYLSSVSFLQVFRHCGGTSGISRPQSSHAAPPSG